MSSATPVAPARPAGDDGGTARPRRSRGRAGPQAYRRKHYLAVAAFLAAVGLVVPELAVGRSDQYLVNLWLVYSITAIGFYWVFGLAGRFAFCQPFMMALGGYTAAWVARSQGEAWFLGGLAAGMAVSALVAAVVAVLVRRGQGFYFAIATIAVAEMGAVFFSKADWFTGPNGTTTGVPPAQVFGREYLEEGDVFWLFLGILGVVLLVAALIERSPLRREAIASRDNREVAAVAGVGTDRAQITLFVLGSAMGGLSGALIGHWTGTVAEASFGIELGIGIFLMLLLGGSHSMWGPVVGAAFYVAVPELLSDLEQYASIVYGVLLLVVIMALPGGLVGGLGRAREALSRRLRPS